MNKLIRLHEETYNRLEALRGKRETFNQVVNRLCSVFETIKAIPDTLGPQHPLVGGQNPDFVAIQRARVAEAKLEQRGLK